MSFKIDLEIRRIGIIPVKNRKGDPISWHSCHKVPNNKLQRRQLETKKLKELVKIQVNRIPILFKSHNETIKIFFQIASPTGKRTLGCSIYKGKHPEESGIYVQTTKPGLFYFNRSSGTYLNIIFSIILFLFKGGLARRAGLRAGDQIIECNGINFEDIDLAEAVIHLKSGKI